MSLPFKETLNGDLKLYNGLIHVAMNGGDKEYIYSFYKEKPPGTFPFLKTGKDYRWMELDLDITQR
jgi:hypothetical protein